MRHNIRGRKLARTKEHRLALRRNLVQSLIEHGEIRTTLVKAKEVRAFAERLVTLAIDGGLAARQRAIAMLNDRAIIPAEHQADYDRMSDAKREKVRRARSGRHYRVNKPRPGVKFTTDSVIHRLFVEIGPRMKRRNESRDCSGGYTRIIRTPDRRLGDGGPIAILQFVGESDAPRPKLTDKTQRKRRSAVRYSFYAGKPLPRRGRRTEKKPAEPAARKSAKSIARGKAATDKPDAEKSD
jgi:large subunit ribosomal protein L17